MVEDLFGLYTLAEHFFCDDLDHHGFGFLQFLQLLAVDFLHFLYRHLSCLGVVGCLHSIPHFQSALVDHELVL